jgi:hypothetical protein
MFNEIEGNSIKLLIVLVFVFFIYNYFTLLVGNP